MMPPPGPQRPDDAWAAYAARHSEAEPALLARLRRATWLRTTHPHMLTDPYQGRLLAMLSQLLRPHRILELGTFTGYATLCLAEGLAPGGWIDTVEPNDELNELQDAFWMEAEMRDRIVRHNAEAHEVLARLEGPWDLAWIDADKARTGEYVEAVLAQTRPGGLILVDNVMWWGKVLEGENATDKDARNLHALNAAWREDPRVENVLLPIRDGIHALRKR